MSSFCEYSSRQQINQVLLVSIIFFVLTFFALSLSYSNTIEFTEDFKWTASDARSGEGFGWSTAISGNLAVIGANVGNASTGEGVYIFDVATGQEQYKWFPTFTGNLDALGFSVDISGTIAIAGMPGASNPAVGTNTGSAFLFDAVTGQQLHELAASDSEDGDRFGQSVAIDGGLAAVGAKWHDLPGLNSAGQVYVYDVQTGAELSRLSLTSGLNPTNLGDAVDISNGKVIASATNGNGTPHAPNGAAYVFDALTGQLLNRLTPSDGEAAEGFGESLSISGDHAVVGALGNTENGLNAGAAYVYDLSTGNELFKLTPLDASSEDLFGASVDLVGNLALIGAHGVGDPRAGAAYLFDISTGTQLAKFTGTDVNDGPSFGISSALGEEFILVGAFRNENRTGAVYGFRRIPEPTTLTLATLSLLAIACFRRRLPNTPNSI